MEFTRTPKGRWHARWGEPRISVVVAGTDDAPHPALESAVRDLVARWPEVRRAIEEFAAALATSTSVQLKPPLSGGFAAANCGFDGELSYMAIEVTDPEAPSRASVTFYTGLPDGYASYEVVLESSRPIAIDAFAS
jgi:hypothetical protein